MAADLRDTFERAEAILIEGYRRMSPKEKLERVNEMTKTAQQFAAARIRKQYGPLSDRELKLRLAARWLGRETMIRLFDWNPEREGY